MNVELRKGEFMDRINGYDSCSLSYDARAALYDYIEEQISDGVIDEEVCIGDWAIVTSEESALELLEEHDVDLDEEGLDSDDTDELVTYVQDRISYDGFDNCYADSVHLGNDVLLLVSL